MAIDCTVPGTRYRYKTGINTNNTGTWYQVPVPYVYSNKAKQIKNTRKRAPPQQRIDNISYHNMRKYLWIKTKILIKYYMLLS